MELGAVKKMPELFKCAGIFVLVTLDLLCVAKGLVVYKTCQNVKDSLGANATDDEYVLYLNNKVGVSIYCYGMNSTGQPVEYLTLRAGKSNNFASVYDNVGKPGACGSIHPTQLNPIRGRTTYDKVAFNVNTMQIDISDFRFTNQNGPTKIRYATAGDKYASSASCNAMGNFKTDFTGTPFVISQDVQWTWVGTYPGGSQTGKASITNSTYVGCFTDKGDRLLPSAFLNSGRMTVEMCLSHCKSQHFSFAGVQYYSQCFCGNSHDRYPSTPDTQCNAPCRGNSKQKCGGTWRLSVYGTGLPQVLQGNCGGYPGNCFPALKTNPSQAYLKLQIISSHPCLQSATPCQNEGKCIAISASNYKCQCYQGYSGHNCDIPDETIVTDGSSCPAGLQPEKCLCVSNTCTGAKFSGDTCSTSTGQPKVTCRYGDPSHVILFNQDTSKGASHVSCPKGSTMVGCTYWDTSGRKRSNGQADNVNLSAGTCSIRSCSQCTLQARCKKYDCGCKNQGHCHKITGECVCTDGYYGDKCQHFDYCSFVEKQTGQPACGAGGVCSSAPQNSIRAYGGDQRGDYCVFPFDYNSTSFGKCVEDNEVGPPFACGTKFDGSRNGYIDLGQWSPGPVYTMAAWVRPSIADPRTRRTIIGGAASCRDFGIYSFGNFWGYYKSAGTACTSGVDSRVSINVGQWYLVAVVSNGTHVTSIANGQTRTVKTQYKVLPTTEGLWIGGETCCATGRFKGMMKTAKIWKRALSYSEISNSMNTLGNSKSTDEALNGGLVGHWELGENLKQPCSGTDHGGADWTLTDGYIVSGIHCNISKFYIPQDVTVTVTPYNKGSGNGGTLDIQAQDIEIDGMLDGSGAGYSGGASPTRAGSPGTQGDSYSGLGKTSTQDNRGGGGGGYGGSQRGDGAGEPGGGAGYGTLGGKAVKTKGDLSGLGNGGKLYGDGTLSHLYMGSGGGSGGSAKVLTSNPPGGKGGNGGAAIRLTAERNVVVKGVVSVTGQNGQGDSIATSGCLTACPSACSHSSIVNCYGNSTTACWDYSGPGGGGSGGSIFIRSKVANIGQNTLWAMGGQGGFGTKQGCGGDGGLGRIRVESVIIKGSVSTTQGIFTKAVLQNTYVDHSQAGQKQINYKSTTYGNEVYRGCFLETTVSYRMLSYAVPLTAQVQNKMTPEYCITLCRQKGYMFSGTQYSHECFCDNHLDMTKKRPDSDCNMKCKGDNRLYCGGNFRIQVFGPPPGTPGIGHSGVAQACEPWCLTADVNTRNPKWGQCNTKDSSATSYTTLCNCPPGKQGQGCVQPCDSGMWGKDCALNCTCNVNNTAVCNPVSGICQCKPGYQDDNCQTPCPIGKYGTGCTGVCNCTGNSRCDQQTGACVCNPGFMGASCKFPCPIGYFGSNCSSQCMCNNHGMCDPISGVCQCDPGYTNEVCGTQCDLYTYGVDCLQRCNCSGSPCDAVTGRCTCNPGKTGSKCQMDCPFQTYGKDCAKTCTCPGSCDPVTGVCHCPPGFFGDQCQFECTAGSYGSNCQSVCKCVMNQTQTCDKLFGACTCKPGFIGHKCELACPLGYYGNGCNSTCGQCGHGAKCDPVTGKCICRPGWTGDTCQQACPNGYYGNKCQTRCPACPSGVCDKVTGNCICLQSSTCQCSYGYYGNNCGSICNCYVGNCQNGGCTCEAGWTGLNCGQPCTTGLYGVNCQQSCQCVHGKCHPGTGDCVCDPGYSGPRCDVQCQNKTYGAGCISQCYFCIYSSSCDPATGTCVCNPGYKGVLCDSKCPSGTYGNGCKQSCSCLNGGTCNNVDGTCMCPDGFTGPSCAQKCPVGTYGFNCTKTCNCGVHASGCDPITGVCKCKPGFLGGQCLHTCQRNAWGQDCNSACSDVCNMTGTVICSPIDGTCQCKPGYSGNKCEFACPVGKWGINCAQTCECSSHGNCDRVTGSCDCDPGYNGTRCEKVCQKDRFWGKRCSNVCNCNGATCSAVTGQCQCPPGKMGHHCEQDCGAYHFGFNCAQLCGCKNGAPCNKVTGECTCIGGWTGPFCDQTCPTGYYGMNCQQQCLDCQNGGSCDPVSGACVCTSGYTGDMCNQTCPVGSWGFQCRMSCSALCPRRCQPQSGVCNCDSNSCQNGGVCNKQGKCQCQYGYYGDDCSQTTGRLVVGQQRSNPNTNTVSLSKGAVVGLVLGVLVLIVLVAVGVFLVMKKKYTGEIFRRKLYGSRMEEDQNGGGFSNPQYDHGGIPNSSLTVNEVPLDKRDTKIEEEDDSNA